MLLLEVAKYKVEVGFRFENYGYWTGNKEPTWYTCCANPTKEECLKERWAIVGPKHFVKWME